jgi:hypothetical protein
MGTTNIHGLQVKDGSICRADLNTATVGSALITKLVTVASTGVLINASSGADAGTGDVSLKIDESYLNSLYPRLSTSRAQNTFLAAPSASAGGAGFRTITAADVPILNQSTSGNALTATTLQTARSINGVSFNGSANITVTADAGTLSGTTLKSTVVNSSLTSVGTLASLSVTGGISAGGLGINGAYAGVTFAGGTYTSAIYSDGANLIIANDGMIYLQSVTGGVLYAKGQKLASDTWFEMMYNGSTKAKTVIGGFSVTGCGYFSNSIEVTGDIKATGDGYFFNSVSDMRLKTDFERMTPNYGIGIVRKTNPYWFTWLTGKKEGQRDFGFGAQEMKKILPEMVMHRPDGSLGLYYEHYTAILASAVQYLDEKVNKLELKLLQYGE